MTTPPDPVEIAKQAREHAWNWFALHATQRMQAFNFFVVATAFLIAAESEARRTGIPTEGGQQSDDCGQRVRAA